MPGDSRGIRRWLASRRHGDGAAPDLPAGSRGEKTDGRDRLLLDRIAGSSPEILYVYDAEGMRFSYINDAIESALGHPAAEVTGQGADFMSERLHPADTEAFAEHQRRVIELLDQDVTEVELRLQHRDGSWRWLRMRNRVLSRTDDGSIRELLGTATDITEHIRSQEALRVSEERYRIVSDLTSDYAFSVRVGSDGTLEREWITEAFGRITGYEPEELSESMWEQLVHPDDHAQRRLQFQQAIASGQLIHEYRIIRKSGEVRWIREHARVIRNDDGSIHWYGACQDVTERKLAQEARSLSQERFNAITQSSRDIIAEFDRKARMLYVSPNVHELTGVDPAFIIRHPREDVLHPDDARLVGERIIKAMNTGESESLIFRMRHQDGDWHWMDATVTAFHTNEGEVRALMISRDITDRLKIEDERRRLVSVVENSSEFIAMMMPDGRILFLNDAGHATIGVRGKLRARSITIFDCLAPEDAQDMRFKVLPAVARDGRWEGDFRLRHLETERASRLSPTSSRCRNRRVAVRRCWPSSPATSVNASRRRTSCARAKPGTGCWSRAPMT